jgi:ABC-type glycerol-3-phosphate transport system substrate-binding protein
LGEGENTIELTLTEGSLMIGNIYLEAEPEYAELKTASQADSGTTIITARGETPIYRNDSSIRATCEYDPDLDPYDATTKTLNIIDDASFADAGQSVTYEFEVEESGYYYLGYHYRQSSKVDLPVFMDIVIDDNLIITDDPDKAATSDALTSFAFDYTKSFKNTTVTDADGNKVAIYLEAGTHTITNTISLDNIRETLQVIDDVMNEISDLSLEVSKVSGNTDKYRDIKITDYVPDIEERLDRWITELQEQYDRVAAYSTEEDDIGALSSLNLAIEKLQSLAKEPNKIPYRVTELSTSSSSANQYLANVITDLTQNAISFDSVYLYQENATIAGKSSIFEKIWGAILRFLASFSSQAYSVDNADDTHLQVWINRPRQYLEIIQRMIDNTFTAETGIQVDLSIMPDAQKLILSNAAGNAPDVAQAVDYALPIEFALRDAAVDLTQFDGSKEVLEQFSPGLLVPSTMDGGIYSLPETFYFWVLFYRTDILDKLDIEVPETMEEVEELLPELKNRGLDFFYPTAGTTGTRTFAMTTPLLYQHGASLYGTTAGDTTLDSDEGIEGFTELTELFTIYDIPQEITSFYQHFRNGDIPIGVSDYFMYSMLINAAPEIENSWEIALVPGVETVDEDGEVSIQRQTAGAAQSSMILKNKRSTKVSSNNGDIDREEAAWEYLKWWMSTDTQVEFGITLQTTYGEEYIWNSANTEAFSKLPWKSRDKQTILLEMQNIEETPRIPGTYMLEREISNAYVAVVTNGGILRTELDSAIKRIDRETTRKLKEFGYLDNDGNVVKEYIVPDVDYVKDIINGLD